VDVYTAGFWGCKHQNAIFDVKAFNANASSYFNTQMSPFYRQRSKGSMYNVLEGRRWFFTPLLFSGMGHASTVFYKDLPSFFLLGQGFRIVW